MPELTAVVRANLLSVTGRRRQALRQAMIEVLPADSKERVLVDTVWALLGGDDQPPSLVHSPDSAIVDPEQPPSPLPDSD